MKRILFILALALGSQQLLAQFKFGLAGGYSALVADKGATDIISSVHGGQTGFEFGYLIKDHFEPGVRLNVTFIGKLGNSSMPTTNIDFGGGITLPGPDFGTLKLQDMIFLSVLPYFRYYFLETNKVRPYVVGGIGYAYGFTGQILLGNESNFNYDGSFVTGKIGAGVRLIKYIDFSIAYEPLGRLNRAMTENGKQLDAAQTTDIINFFNGAGRFPNSVIAHSITVQFALTFGGNLAEENNNKKNNKKKKKA